MADDQEKGKPEEEGADTTDWKAMARKWEARSKENAEKARAYDELQEESKTELQKAKEAAEKAKAELDGLKANSIWRVSFPSLSRQLRRLAGPAFLFQRKFQKADTH